MPPVQSVTPVREVPEQEQEHAFRLLADTWSQETAFTASMTKMISHPAYRRIIEMGMSAVPLILRELQAKPDHWFWALQSITGEDPATPNDDFDAAREAWLQWGRKRGFVT